MVFATDAGLGGKDVNDLHSAVMVLVEVLQFVFGERVEIGAAGGKLREDFILVDRVRVVELDDPGLLDKAQRNHQAGSMTFARLSTDTGTSA